VIFERSRGVGGRCATRRVEGQPVDHGAAFVHGSDESFLAVARGASADQLVDGWPRVIEGGGAPCLPKAFTPREQRLAYADGVTALPKALARGLDIRLRSRIESIVPARGGWTVEADTGATTFAPVVVLAVPPRTALKLLAPLSGEGRDAEAIGALLGMIGSQACLTVLAGYPAGGGRPAWDMAYPEDSISVQAISHDSSKRQAPAFVVLVVQARPCWSLMNIEAAEAAWVGALLAETARIAGGWAQNPTWVQAHRWRFARADRGSELSRPVSLRVRGAGRLIITGESFAPGGGIEASWLAGNAAAARIVEEE
jgi:predicted NAD/FAD-dependent oxidoreductase